MLLAPCAAFAAPVTTGVWSAVGDVDPFWDGVSWDCPTCGVGFQLETYTGLAGLEFLHDGTGGYVSFRFDDAVINPTLIFQNTMWDEGVLGRDVTGAFTYDSGTERYSNSWSLPGQYALFRRLGETETNYFLGIEDIPLTEHPNDYDYNDYGVTFALPRQNVPEPSTLLLLSLGVAGAVSTRRRRGVHQG